MILPKFPLILDSSLGLPLYQGKTRDTYRGMRFRDEFGTSLKTLLIVATDRLSTHNVVHASLIPRKGEVLTALTIFWLVDVLERMGIPHHLLAYGRDVYKYLPYGRDQYPEDLHLRAIIVRELEIVPFEFIFRRYLTGSLYKDFYEKGLVNPYGIHLPPDLKKMSKFKEVVFTPTQKSKHDEPVDAEWVKNRYPASYQLASQGFEVTSNYLQGKGIDLIDGKLEIGKGRDNRWYLADEVTTPDSSRFVRMGEVEEGSEPKWLDKQPAREEVELIWKGTGKKEPVTFSRHAINDTSQRYLDVFSKITSSSLDLFQKERMS